MIQLLQVSSFAEKPVSETIMKNREESTIDSSLRLQL